MTVLNSISQSRRKNALKTALYCGLSAVSLLGVSGISGLSAASASGFTTSMPAVVSSHFLIASAVVSLSQDKDQAKPEQEKQKNDSQNKASDSAKKSEGVSKNAKKKEGQGNFDPLTFLPLIGKAPRSSSASDLLSPTLPLPRATAGVGEPGLSLRMKGENTGDNFFYLKDYSQGGLNQGGINNAGTNIGGLSTSVSLLKNNPLASAQAGNLLMPIGGVGDSNSQMLLGYNAGRIGIISPSKGPQNSKGTGFELALQSSMYLTVNHDILGVSDTFVDREYALGLSMGYYGFNLDAAIHDQQNANMPEFSGYGVGLSYSTKRLWTRLGYKDLNARPYSSTVASFSDRLISSDLNSLELQAAYSLTNNLRLTGGVRYSIYGDPLTFSGFDRDSDQTIYLGTRWSF